MAIQPQIDVQLLNDVLRGPAKKRLNDVLKHSVYKAAQVYANQMGFEGLYALITYHLYFNETQEALECLNKAYLMYGYNLELFDVALEIKRKTGRIEDVLIEGCRYLTLSAQSDDLKEIFKEQAYFLSAYCLANLTDMQQMQPLSRFLSDDEIKKMSHYITSQLTGLEKLGVTRTTYQRFFAIVDEIINQYYVKDFHYHLLVKPDMGLAELMVYIDEITPTEAFKINTEIDEAILMAGLTNAVFAEEVSHLTVYCTLTYKKQPKEALV